MKNLNKGMSLIVLVITIITTIVLAGVVVVGLSEDNPIEKAYEAVLRSNLASFTHEFELYIASSMAKDGKRHDIFIDAEGQDIKKYIPSISDKYIDKIVIKSGKLVFVGDKLNEKIAAYDLGYLSEYADVVQDAYAQKIKILVLEFENYIKLNNLTDRRNTIKIGSNYLDKCMPSITDKLKNNYEVIDGVVNYIGNDVGEQLALAVSSHTLNLVSDGKLIIQGYLAPIKYTDPTFEDWEFDNGYIVGYKGKGGVVTIPDGYITELLNGEEGLIKITGLKGKDGKNIFTDENGNLKTKDGEEIKKVIVAKGIYKIEDYALANMGSSVPVNLLNAEKTLELGDGTGLLGSCGSYTYIVPETGTYRFKLWGASGEGNVRGVIFDETNILKFKPYQGEKVGKEMGSQAGYGGYSQGDIRLNKGVAVYVNIGGKGMASLETVEDNGTGGYNGGGNGTIKNNNIASGGGGSTDIRIGGTTAVAGEDNRIIVAGGGGGSDDFKYAASSLGDKANDGTGGYGGGANLPGGSGKNGTNVNEIGATLTTGNKLWKGQDASAGMDMGGGGGGYYGGLASRNSNGGASGGSGYANTSVVSNIIGISGDKNNKSTYYGKEKNCATYGNGAIEIIKIS